MKVNVSVSDQKQRVKASCPHNRIEMTSPTTFELQPVPQECSTSNSTPLSSAPSASLPLFLGLPYDIRYRIYEYVYPSRYLAVTMGYHNYGCDDNWRRYERGRICTCWADYGRSSGFKLAESGVGPPIRSMLPILLTSRQICHEFSYHVYGSNTLASRKPGHF